ncbi:MAG: O-antigen ligase family protein [Candidatus Zixiibacteriota bacterium]|nr:MAG: O-antigen ligase family protein [candidate division Zixibacteria bacterium]
MEHVDRQFITRRHVVWFLLTAVSIAAGISSLFVNSLIIVAAIILIVNVVLMMRYPIWGLLCYLIIFLLRPGEMYPVLSIFRLELVTGVFVLLTIIIRQKVLEGSIYFPKDKITLTLVGFLVVMCLTIFTSYEKTLTFDRCIDFVKLLIFYYLIISIVDTRKKFVAFMSVFLIMIAYIAFDAFKSYISGGFIHRMGVDRMLGTTSAGGDPNTLAATLGATIPIVVASAFYFRHYLLKILLWTLALSMSYLITITASRSGMLAFLAALIGGVVLSRHKIVLAVGGCLLILAVWSVLPDQYRQRYMTLTDTEDISAVSSGRWDIWAAGLKMIVDRPILGVGAGAFSAAAGSKEFGYSRYMQAHNLYIQLLATTGIIGFVVWFAFIFSLTKRLKWFIRRVRDSAELKWASLYSYAFVVAMVALFTSGFFGHNLYRYTWYMMAGMTVAMMGIVKGRVTDGE